MVTVDEPTLAEEATEGITTAGGWCAPTDLVYDLGSLEANAYIGVFTEMPTIRVLRPGTPEYEANQRRLEDARLMELSTQSIVSQLVGNIRDAQDRALQAIYEQAEATGMDVLWEDPPNGHTMWRWSGDRGFAYHFIGLSLVERPDEKWRHLQGDRAIILRQTAHRDSDDWYDW